MLKLGWAAQPSFTSSLVVLRLNRAFFVLVVPLLTELSSYVPLLSFSLFSWLGLTKLRKLG